MRFPETAAGGYSRLDGSVEFYGRIQALLADIHRQDGVVVVDFGAGRGQSAEDPVTYRRNLQELRAPGRTVIGVDVDPVVLDNPRLDAAHVIVPGCPLPLESESVDLVVSDFTFEHVEDAVGTAAELDRILKPGGWICARTPNRWGYIALGARVVPNRLHVRALRKLQPTKRADDTFDTRYHMNTRRDLERLFPAPRFALHAFCADNEPYLYGGGSRAISGLITVLRLLPPSLRSMWTIFIQKQLSTGG